MNAAECDAPSSCPGSHARPELTGCNRGVLWGVCPVCSRRLNLSSLGLLPVHEERESEEADR